MYFFRQITTFIKVRMAFLFGLQTLWLKDFSKIFQLKFLKPKKRPHKLLWMLWFDKKVYLPKKHIGIQDLIWNKNSIFQLSVNILRHRWNWKIACKKTSLSLLFLDIWYIWMRNLWSHNSSFKKSLHDCQLSWRALKIWIKAHVIFSKQCRENFFFFSCIY